jgi:hypothetical protein
METWFLPLPVASNFPQHDSVLFARVLRARVEILGLGDEHHAHLSEKHAHAYLGLPLAFPFSDMMFATHALS